MIIPQIKISVAFEPQTLKRDLVQVLNSKDCHTVLMQCFDPSTINWKEEFHMLCLNRNNKVVGYYKVSEGGCSGTVVDSKVIFTTALNTGAHSIVLAHNHPSGNMKPSSADLAITKKLKDAGNLLEIMVMDHLIISDSEYFSFADDGLM
ncbi:MAG: JAB domain-containing protein [Bacteroidia bacterium]|jgi:DNA repair protein RadC